MFEKYRRKIRIHVNKGWSTCGTQMVFFNFPIDKGKGTEAL